MVRTSPSVFTVDLAAIQHNARLAKHLAGGLPLLAPVKAAAYGHGLVQVAQALAEVADWFGVALVAEAEELREAGITIPILKFTHTFADELAQAIAAELTLTVATEDEVAAVAAAAQQADRIVDVQLKVDTGMRRLGVTSDHAAGLAQRIVAEPRLRLTGIYSHLAISDEEVGREYTQTQLASFRQAAEQVQAKVGQLDWVHIANSGGVHFHELSGTNLIRPGIMIYGNPPDPGRPNPELRPVAQWTSRLAALRPVAAGETVGYGRRWTAARDTWIATVAIGYGDGYSRLLSNRGRMLIQGRSYPIVGRVCMDQTMIDLGPQPPQLAVGEQVVLLGRSGDETITVDELAQLSETISYEVTCRISDRVPRHYLAVD